MPLPQRNFGYSAYESDNGTTFCKKADASWIANTDSGGAACAGEPAYGATTTRRHPRYAIYQDPTTFRTVTEPVFTAAAYAALVPNTSTLSVPVVGSATPVTYTLVSLVAEKQGRTTLGQPRPDHA